MNRINQLHRPASPTTRSRVWALSVLAATIICSASTSLASGSEATHQEQRVEQRTFSPRPGTEVNVENLAGGMVVEGTASGDIEIVATIHAESGDLADAPTLLDALGIEFNERQDRIDVDVIYPDEFDKFRYPRGDRGNYNNQTRYRDRRVRVTGRDDNDAVTLYVDFEIRVPPGVAVAIDNHVGDVSATGVQGDFSADTGSGDVTTRDGTGVVTADTGSGDVSVVGHTGRVNVDTGSGDVEISNVSGDVVADTGSGDVSLSDVDARSIEADTGSGTIEMSEVSGSINADTGSGDIVGRELRGATMISADTGSGDVRLAGDMSQVEEIEIDTSSGSVELTMTSVPGMRITVETGNGSINIDLPGLTTSASRRRYFRGEVGDGRARVNIDTGSGSVRISSR